MMVDDFAWSKTEKQVARRAFDIAYSKECGAIRARVQQMFRDGQDIRVIWRIHDYLSEQRKQTDRKYVYRYSRLIDVFAILLIEGWLSESDLNGLTESKIIKIRDLASRL